ncbi:glycosyltransferase [Streptomyces sp. NPDC002685]|uniref:glycosyltransferase n=1 Tax=Streptomyces sp. NPDC002685 TaxID=3154540 RepID=UPI003327FE14
MLRHSAGLGGMGRAAEFFTPALRRLCPIVAVVSLSAKRTSDGFEASWPAKVGATASAVGRCAMVLVRESPDAVYLPIAQWGLPLLRDALVVALARATGSTPVLHLHGAQLPARLSAALPLRKVLGGAHWIVLSEDVAANLQTSGCRTRSVTVIRNPAPAPEHALPQQNGGPPTASCASRPLRVGWLGTMCRAKGFDVLCDAVDRVKRRDAAVEFSVAGMRLDVPRSRMGSVDRDLGVVHQADVPEFWSTVDVFVLPARWVEGLPFVLLEALQAGCVVAATRSSGSAELFRHGCVDAVEPTVDSVTGFLEACRTDLDGVRRRQQKAWRQLRPLYAHDRVEGAFARFWETAPFGRG